MSEESYSANLGPCDPSDCASCSSNCGGADAGSIPLVPNPTIKLTLDDNRVLECAVLTTFTVEDFGEYIALLPLNENGKSMGEVFLFRFKEDEDGNPIVSNIEREDEYMAAAESYNKFIENLPSEESLDKEK